MKRIVVLMVGVAAIVAAGAGATGPGPNGLLVFSQLVGGKYQLFTIRPDGSHVRQITRLHGDATHPDWAPNGLKLLFSLETETDATIAEIAADGGHLRIFPPDGQGQAAYSPDGKSIVYERYIAKDNNGLWLMRADATDKRRVTRTPGCCDADPNFSPDGKLITFVRIRKEGKLQALFAVRPDGTGLRQLTPFAWDVAIKHDWSPDGKLIVLTRNVDFANHAEAATVATIHPDGSGLKQLTPSKADTNAVAGSFSPDGKQIVFRIEEGENSGIALMKRDGSNMHRLTSPSKDKPRFIDWGTHR